MRGWRLALAVGLVALAAGLAPVQGSASTGESISTPGSAHGYWLVGADGTVFEFGRAGLLGSVTGAPPIVDAETTPSGLGYWLAAANGSLFAFGDARFLGSMASQPLKAPIVGLADTPSGQGYWLVAADGGIFSFGDARFLGSTGGIRLNKPVVGMATTPSGGGYWFVASDGGIFAFGDAGFFGSMGGTPLNQPVVGMAATPSGQGYWLVAADGGIFAFGDARFFGSTGGIRLNRPVVGMAATPSGAGYWFVASDGGIFAFGDAVFFGSTAARGLVPPVVAIAALPPSRPIAPAVAEPAPIDPAARPPDPPPPVTTTTTVPIAPGGAFDVGLLGDTAYTSEQEKDLLRVREHMNSHPLAFTVHDGDIWSNGDSCSENHARRVREVFDGFDHPFVYTPGDNEWFDCGGESRLAGLRRVFFSTAESLGQLRLLLARQPEYPENARWNRSGVVFVTLNVPGPDGPDSGSLEAANEAWLNAAFDEAEATAAPAVMVIWQDNPYVPDENSLFGLLKDRASRFRRPVMLVHGDTHTFGVRHSGRNLTVVETFADVDSHRWVRVTVDPDSPKVFTVHKMEAG